MTALIGSKSCRSCEHILKFNGGLFCRRNPPTVIPIIQAGPNGAPQALVHSSYPPVNPDQPCGEYLRNDILAAEELRDVSTGLRQ